VSAPADWWRSFFTGPALELWRLAIPRETTLAQVEALVRLLELRPGERLLDVPCGNGRLALELAARGFLVSGLDLSHELVEEGLRAAAERALTLDLRAGDMRALPWEGLFDAAICAGNSFGYFTDQENRDFLAGVARRLRPGGRFLLEYPLVAEISLERREPRSWQRRGDLILLSESSHDVERARLETTYVFVDLARGTSESRPASFRIYSARDVRVLLDEVGLGSHVFLGDLDGSPFGPHSPGFFVRALRS
jgi:SAM-dependent methyltransferase